MMLPAVRKVGNVQNCSADYHYIADGLAVVFDECAQQSTNHNNSEQECIRNSDANGDAEPNPYPVHRHLAVENYTLREGDLTN